MEKNSALPENKLNVYELLSRVPYPSGIDGKGIKLLPSGLFALAVHCCMVGFGYYPIGDFSMKPKDENDSGSDLFIEANSKVIKDTTYAADWRVLVNADQTTVLKYFHPYSESQFHLTISSFRGRVFLSFVETFDQGDSFQPAHVCGLTVERYVLEENYSVLSRQTTIAEFEKIFNDLGSLASTMATYIISPMKNSMTPCDPLEIRFLSASPFSLSAVANLFEKKTVFVSVGIIVVSVALIKVLSRR